MDTRDSWFSRWIKDRDRWRCQRCNSKFSEGSPLLECSHLFVRSKWPTRFDPDNCDALCKLSCHPYFEHHRQDYRRWKQKRLGEESLAALELRSNSPATSSPTLADLKATLLP